MKLGNTKIYAKAPRLISFVSLAFIIFTFTWLIITFLPTNWLDFGQAERASKNLSILILFIVGLYLVIQANAIIAFATSLITGKSLVLKNDNMKIINEGKYVLSIKEVDVERITYGNTRTNWKNFNFDYIPYKIYMKNNSKPLFFDIYTHFNNVEEINKILEARFGKLEYEKFDI